METAALIIQGRDDYTASEPVAGTMPLLRIIRTFQYAGIKRVIVAGEDYIMNEAFKQATRLEAEFIHTTRLKTKSASYHVNAITYLKDKCDRLLIAPVYYPLFDISTVRKMLETDATLAAALYKGKRGYPILLSSEFFDAAIEADGDYQKLLDENDWQKIEVDDEGVVTDVTKRVDANRIAGKLSLDKDVRPGFKLTLRRAASFYGPGVQEMIRLVDESGSLKTAFSLMGMAGSYARRTIKEAETGLGFKLFESDIENKQYGSAVTQEAKDFAAIYEAFHEDCANYIEESFKRHFKDL